MKPIFLDRDGVINEDPGERLYVMRPDELCFIPGSIDAMKEFSDNGYDVYIISNQAGVAKGLFTQAALDEVTERLLDEIKRAGAKVASINYCPHRDEDNCDCRKPKTGLFNKAVGEAHIDFSKTYFIGDGKADIEAGKSVGCKTVLVLSGKSSIADVEGWQVKPNFIKKDLAEAANFILNTDGRR